MAVLSGWVNSVTGLPCFKVEGRGKLETADGRVVFENNNGGVAYVSDIFAPPGVAVTYKFAGKQVALTRLVKCREGGALFTSVDGVQVAVDFYEGPTDDWTSDTGVSEFSNGVVRFGTARREGGCRVWLESSPELIKSLMQVLESRGLVSVALDRPASGVPQVRCVLVSKSSVSRVDTEGVHRVDVEWVEKPFPVLQLSAFSGGFAGGAATWNEATRLGFKWTAGWSYETLVNRLGGAL